MISKVLDVNVFFHDQRMLITNQTKVEFINVV